MSEPRALNAGNAGPFTLDGTRTYLVGERRVAVVDPGPDVVEHVRAVVRSVASADRVVLLQTHDHQDHAGAAAALAARLGAPVLGAGEGARELEDGAAVETDHGELRAVPTPGHARRHLAFHWPAAGAVFVGDLLLGRGDTTWVGAYPGCVRDYLESLDRIEGLGADVLYPTHGPPLRDPLEVLGRYREHREERLAQLERALAGAPDADPGTLVDLVYGDELPPDTREAALASVEAMIHHLREEPAG